jgi:hypothetical protein
MATHAESILYDLKQVTLERLKRQSDPELLAAVHRLKAYQQQRFSHTYADLLRHPRYQAASRFFLEELYGPSDFTQRDDQFARVVPALVRLFPDDIVSTVATLAELHAISERLDTQMAIHLGQVRLDASAYVAAWQATAQPQARDQQIALTLRVGERLDRLTRNPLLRHSLRMMRGPARTAGLSELQRFLEAGFDTFRQMRGAADFLSMIGEREHALAAALFDAQPPYTEAAAVAYLPPNETAAPDPGLGQVP